jgi:hypothetical protein
MATTSRLAILPPFKRFLLTPAQDNKFPRRLRARNPASELIESASPQLFLVSEDHLYFGETEASFGAMIHHLGASIRSDPVSLQSIGAAR